MSTLGKPSMRIAVTLGRVRVWELHRLYAADESMRLLEREGIKAHMRGLRHRSALYFFGPYIPVEVMVAPGDAERAHACLSSHLAC